MVILRNRYKTATALLALGTILLCGAAVFLIHCRLSSSKKAAALSSAHKTGTEASAPPIKKTADGCWESRQKIYFNIPAHILITSPDVSEKLAHRAIYRAWAEFERLGRIFNPFDSAAEVARINRNSGGGGVPVSADLYRALKISRNLWDKSNGCFDPTFLPIKRLWHHAEEIQEIPSERKILKTLRHTGFENVGIESEKRNRVRIENPPIRFDFGGIAKGYAVDQVRQLLKKNGISDGLVQLGGEVAAFGRNKGSPWRIGIEHPKKNMVQPWGVISRNGQIRVSTSGNYRQPLRIQGQTFYHIFSPETGKPVSEKVLGVTTLSVTGTRSNALLDGAATAITVMGARNGVEFADKMGIEALILTRGHDQTIRETMTPGFPDFPGR